MSTTQAVLDLIISLRDEASAGLAGIAGTLTSTVAPAAAGAAVAVGGIFAGVGAVAFSTADQIDQATDRMTSALALSEGGAANFEGVLKSIYANNYGESFDDIAASLVSVEGAFGRLGGTQGVGELQQVTEEALAIRDAFGVEVTESANAAATLIQDFGLTAEEAMNFLAAGFQNGLNASDDFLDTIGEYSTQFANGGATAEEFFSLLQSGMQGGMLGTDKAADAFKEFRVRIQDGSTLTAASLEMIGINADELAAKMADGSVTAADAFQQVMEALNATDDANVRMQAGVGLLGTQFEDLGTEGALALSLVGTSLEELSGATDALNAQYSNLGSVFEGFKREVLVALAPLGDELLAVANDAMPTVKAGFAWFRDQLPSIIETGRSAIRGAVETVGSLVEAGRLLATGDFQGGIFGLEEDSSQIATLLQVRDTLLTVGQSLSDFVMQARASFEANWPTIQAVVLTAMAVIQAVIRAALGVIGPAVATLFQTLQKHGDDFKTIWEALAPVLGTVAAAIGAILLTLVGVVSGVFSGIAAAIDPFIEMVMRVAISISIAFEGIVMVLTGAFEFLVGLFTGNTELMSQAWERMSQGIQGIVMGLQLAVLSIVTGFVQTALAFFGGFVQGVIDFFANLYDELVGHSIVPDMVNGILGWFTTLYDRGVASIRSLWQEVGKLFDTAKNNLIQAATNIGEGIANAINDAVDSVVDGIRETLNKIINLMNTAISSFNTLPGPDIPMIPTFAKGTPFAPGGLALVGENGPELVSIPRGSRVMTAGRSRALLTEGGTGGGIQVNVFIERVSNDMDVEEMVWKVALGLQERGYGV